MVASRVRKSCEIALGKTFPQRSAQAHEAGRECRQRDDQQQGYRVHGGFLDSAGTVGRDA
jgi:hypothetical protein